MLEFRISLHSIEESITRNIIITICKDIKRLLGINRKVYVVYDDKDLFFRKKTNNGQIQLDNTLKEDVIRISHEEEILDDHELVLTMKSPDAKPIYCDHDVNCSLTPVYIYRRMSINFRYSHRSKSEINAIINKLKLFAVHDGMYNNHKLTYHYTIPLHVNELIDTIRKLKNNKEEHCSVVDYINKTFDNRVDFIHPINGDTLKSELGIKESQVNVEGYIEDNLNSIKSDFEEDYNVNTIEFTYAFEFEKPVALIMRYPVIIYNQLIPEKFRLFINNTKVLNGNYIENRGELREKMLPQHSYDTSDRNFYLNLTPYDVIRLPRPISYIKRLLCVMIQVDENNPYDIFNLDELPNIKFKDTVKEYILENCEYISKLGEAAFYFEIFKHDTKDGDNSITMDKYGNMKSNKKLDIKCIYRLVINVVVDLTILKDKAKKRYNDFVNKQIMESKEESHTMEEFKDFWKEVKYDRFQELKKDNLLTDYISLLNIEPEILNEAIDNSNKVTDIPFRLSLDYPLRMKTVMIHHSLDAILEDKE